MTKAILVLFLPYQITKNPKFLIQNHLALAADVNADANILGWWKNHSCPGSDFCLPHWSSAVWKVLLVQPSSSTAECVFSMLNQSFGEQQDALEDLMETTIMLQNNKRKN